MKFISGLILGFMAAAIIAACAYSIFDYYSAGQKVLALGETYDAVR